MAAIPNATLNLESCTNLRKLSLWMHWAGDAHPSANVDVLDYLLGVLSGIPCEKSPLLLDQLCLSLRFSRGWKRTDAHGSLEGSRPWLHPVEAKLLGGVERGILLSVRIAFDADLGENKNYDASFVSGFFPRLHAAGVLSFGQ